MNRSMTALATLALAAVVAMAGFAAIASSATSKPATVKTGTSALGRIVVDGQSHTLYLFAKDKNGKSACSGACAQNWPPLLTKGTPKAGTGAKASLLGTTKRADGTTQVTYNKHPLYTFIADQGKRGSTKGERLDAFGGRWYVVTAKGTAKTGRY
jgi:predicted lipoprotein with Yx(FWY)xxD motif